MQTHNPYTFISFTGGSAIKCNIKSVNDGFLFPLDKGLFFIQKFLFIKKSEVGAIVLKSFLWIVLYFYDTQLGRFSGWISEEPAP